MNLELEKLVKAAKLDGADNERLRLELGLLFVERIEQQLERDQALDALKQFTKANLAHLNHLHG